MAGAGNYNWLMYASDNYRKGQSLYNFDTEDADPALIYIGLDENFTPVSMTYAE